MVLYLVFMLFAQKSSFYHIKFNSDSHAKLKIWTLPLTCTYVCEYFIYSVDISDMEYIHSCCRHYQQGSYKLVVISNTVHKYTLLFHDTHRLHSFIVFLLLFYISLDFFSGNNEQCVL